MTKSEAIIITRHLKREKERLDSIKRKKEQKRYLENWVSKQKENYNKYNNQKP